MGINEDFETLITDIAIDVVNELVEQGIVKDCTDTNDSTRFIKSMRLFYFQDAIKDVLHRYQANFKYE